MGDDRTNYTSIDINVWFENAGLSLCSTSRRIGLSIEFAASESQRPPVPAAAVGALIMWWICSRRKQQPIGGWLLYYFIQLYLGFVLVLFMTVIALENYRPAAWEDCTLYYLFLLSTVPGFLIEIAQVVVATGLLR